MEKETHNFIIRTIKDGITEYPIAYNKIDFETLIITIICNGKPQILPFPLKYYHKKASYISHIAVRISHGFPKASKNTLQK